MQIRSGQNPEGGDVIDLFAGGPPVDFEALFAAAPAAYLVLTPELVICEVNAAYLRATGRERAELLGRHVFDAFPENPATPGATNTRDLEASLQLVLATGEPDVMSLLRYDIPVGGGRFEERWWSPVNTPVFGADGTVSLIIHRGEDVTSYARAQGLDRPTPAGGDDPAGTVSEAETHLVSALRSLHESNEQLRQAREREHRVAARLQRAMLPAVVPATRCTVATRYRPAGPLQICGDWYDLVALGADRLSVSVGDVVGRGLPAAGVMGQLRSALTATTLGGEGPATALEVLDRFARTIDGAESSTALQAVIDLTAKEITYSRAGHLPAMLVHPNGAVEELDQATGVPLAALPESAPRPEATIRCATGCTLVLYTDGLIERRGEDIDARLARLAASLARHATLNPEPLADAILADFTDGTDADDDLALIIVRI